MQHRVIQDIFSVELLYLLTYVVKGKRFESLAWSDSYCIICLGALGQPLSLAKQLALTRPSAPPLPEISDVF